MKSGSPGSVPSLFPEITQEQVWGVWHMGVDLTHPGRVLTPKMRAHPYIYCLLIRSLECARVRATTHPCILWFSGCDRKKTADRPGRPQGNPPALTSPEVLGYGGLYSGRLPSSSSGDIGPSSQLDLNMLPTV